MTERDKLLNDIYFKIDIQEHLAKKYDKTPSYISQLAKSLKQLQYYPTTKDNKLICSNCEKSYTNLIFHHNHKTNQLIALVCHSCNLKLKNKDLDGNVIYKYEHKELTESQNQIIYKLFLNGGEYTTQDIYKETGIPYDNINVYLNDLKNKGKIKVIDKIGRFNIYTLIPREERKINEKDEEIYQVTFAETLLIEYLKFLNDFFKDNVDHFMKNKKIVNFILKNENKFNDIEKIIKKESKNE